MKNKEQYKLKKLEIPETINTDLTYYMQFGWKRIKEVTDVKKEAIKYHKTVYGNLFKT